MKIKMSERFVKHREDTRKAFDMISNLARHHDIVIRGFLRDGTNSSLVGVVIGFVPPIKEEDLENGE